MKKLDYSKITDVEVDGIDYSDYPDFCDAYICGATYDGREMTEEEIEDLDSGFVYDEVIKQVF